MSDWSSDRAKSAYVWSYFTHLAIDPGPEEDAQIADPEPVRPLPVLHRKQEEPLAPGSIIHEIA